MSAEHPAERVLVITLRTLRSECVIRYNAAVNTRTVEQRIWLSQADTWFVSVRFNLVLDDESKDPGWDTHCALVNLCILTSDASFPFSTRVSVLRLLSRCVVSGKRVRHCLVKLRYALLSSGVFFQLTAHTSICVFWHGFVMEGIYSPPPSLSHPPTDSPNF